MVEIQNRKEALGRFTSDLVVTEEILEYTANRFFSNKKLPNTFDSAFPDENFVPVWRGYLNESKDKGLFETLKFHLVQFCFPIEKNISLTERYRSATLKGNVLKNMHPSDGLQLNRPDDLELSIHKSPAGRIPVLTVPDSGDFCSVVQALSHRNEPVKIPSSMGAAMIQGINNWSRIRKMKSKWLNQNPFGNWGMEFMKNIVPNKNLYQDKIIVLSKNPYSGISQQSMGLPLEEWVKKSRIIRLEHECAHYFTLRRFGSMANNLHDELLADYMGLLKAFGKFESAHFLKFMGLERYPKYRVGGRMENYLGNPKLSPKSFEVLKSILVEAALNVASFDRMIGSMATPQDGARRLVALCSVDLLEMASKEGTAKLSSEYNLQNSEGVV